MENTLVTYRRLSTCMPATRVQMKVSDKSVLIKFPLVKISYSPPIKLLRSTTVAKSTFTQGDI